MKEFHKYFTIPLIIGIFLIIFRAILEPIISYIVYPNGAESYMTALDIINPFLIIAGMIIIVLTIILFITRDKKGGFGVAFVDEPLDGPDIRVTNYNKDGVIWPISYRLDRIRGNYIHVNQPQCPNCRRDLRHEERGTIRKRYVLKCLTCESE